MTTTNTSTNNTSKPTEADIYDRQIRLWGADAQKKMQSSMVLYINVTGVSSEIIKNLVLAGIAATLCDNRPATSLEASPCFFTPVDQYSRSSTANGDGDDTKTGTGDDTNGEPAPKKAKASTVANAVQPLIEELNPLLGTCPILSKDISELTMEDLSKFSIIVASQIPLKDAVRISQLIADSPSSLSSSSPPPAFYLVDCFGMSGAAITDLGPNFRYRPEQGKKLLDPVGFKDGYVSFSDIVSTPLSDCINRFHKKGPPPTWVLYRCLLEIQAQTGCWVGDHGNYDDDDDEKKKNLKSIVDDYLKAQNVSNVTDDEVSRMLVAGMAQVAPVCAVLGGSLGNEIIKVVGGKGEPANNTLLFDGEACKMWSFMVKPPASASVN
mmetsp:Transcript_7625/g.18832  ORF Transcript_7625/g.18832 Transcript_7625/m.18832 type:complete len:381 (-) Transcript_7625:2903-4045(-)